MPLFFLNGPSVPNAVGSVINILNAKTGSSQSMHWSFEQSNGWFQASRRYKNTLRVFTNSPFVGPVQVQQAVLGIGALQGAYYRFPLPELNGDGIAPVGTEIDTGSFCQSVNIEQDAEDGRQWTVTLEYGPTDINHEYGSSQTANGSINPLESAPEVDWSGVIFDCAFPQDANGVPFLNVAGDPLENPPPVEEARQSLKFTRNEATYNDNYAQGYRMRLNSDPFLGFAPLQAKCKNINAKRSYTSDFGYFWRVEYEFEFRVMTFTDQDGTVTTYGFQEVVLNAGLRQLDSDGNLQQILIGGIPITNPVALNADGSVLNTTWEYDDGSESTDNPEPYYLVFQNYPTTSFAALNIPQDILTANQ